MAKVAIYAYNNGSAGAKELSEASGVARIKHKGSKFVPKADKIIVNWGATSENFPPELNVCRVLNRPEAVTNAVNKARAFEIFRDAGVSTPEFTTDLAVARRWVEDGHMVFARTMLRAHSGRGIHVMDPDFPDTWNVNAPLFTKYVKKKNEFRIHVANGQVLDSQRKGVSQEFRAQNDVNFLIQNLANGFVYVRNDGRPIPQCVYDVAIASINALGLDFGAADVIYNQRQDQAYVLEVNTAPGISNSTVESYANFLRTL